MLAYSSSKTASTGAAKRRAAILAIAAGALVLSACDDGRAFKNQSQQGQSAKLVVPDTLTPPVRVMPVTGAPARWKLHDRVADALRQRDIPAGVKMRGSHVYVLRGRVVQINPAGPQTQVTVKWRLLDGNGTQVGEVTQMAAIPNNQTGAAKDSSDDVTQAMADAAAESLSPIVPSSRLRTSQQAMTGLPSKRIRREYEKRNPVTAIGKGGKKQSGLSRNLLKPGKTDDGRKAVTGSAGGTAAPKTALGRRGAGKSPLSKNLMQKKPLRVPAGKRKALPVPGKKSSTGSNTQKRVTPTARRDRRPERVSGTTSNARRAPVTRTPAAPSGTMEDLFRRNPTRTEQEDGVVARRDAPARKTADKTVRTPPARRTRQIAAAPKKVRAQPRRTQARRTQTRRTQARRRALRRNPKKQTRAINTARRVRTARDVVPGRRVYWVQIGSYRSRLVAERRWRAARRAGGQALHEANRRIMRAKVERRGVFYRIQVGPYTRRKAATTVCRTLRDRDIACFLYRETEQASLPVTRAGGPRLKPKAHRVTRAILRSKPRTGPATPKAARKGVRVKITDGPRISPDPRPDKAPVSTSPGLPGLKN